jgi:4-diphosphocytidyl-2-C-methyl-D-erythritol kinase
MLRSAPVRVAKLQSLAKINLDLRVLNKRADGFHELRTVFQTISLSDTIEIEYLPARRTELAIDDPLAIPDNLVLRAARAVLEATKTRAVVRFRLTKNIPMGGGLGGGSSNAAAVLLALPALLGKPIPLEQLIDLGATLGSDVPFFLAGGTALGLGRGTELYPLPDLEADPLIVVCPDVHSSTADAYRSLNRSLTVTPSSSKLNTFPTYVRALTTSRSARIAGPIARNDFEAAVICQHPQLRSLGRRLRGLGAACVQMTGSGAAFFAVFDSRTARDEALRAWQHGRGNAPAVAAGIVGQRRYQALWRRQLSEHVTGEALWPPQSRYA